MSKITKRANERKPGFIMGTVTHKIAKKLMVTAVIGLTSLNVFAQQGLPANWYNLDLKADGVFGISMEKAYAELLKGKKPKPVIVAVIDGGLDISHEDLQGKIWTNSKEIAGNGKDDDKNGYVDDVHGWNFLGSSKESFEYTNDAIVQEVRKLRVSPDTAKYKSKLAELNDQIKKAVAEKDSLAINYYLNLDYDPRSKNAKEYAQERFYGNGNVGGNLPPAHGTHVAGIIAAVRNNGIGISGVADAVLLMPIRTIPDGDAREKDIANAIRYAVDNGASVINMSFGFSAAAEDAGMVISAVKYAVSKDVLFICASGNGNDEMKNAGGYPDRESDRDKYLTDVFIKVSASGFADDANLKVSFSNWSKTTVDVFAPGLGINSTIPGNKYEVHSGTSMAAPVVAGMAAVIRSYYPKLTAKQVKEIIIKSVVKREPLKEKCITGGVVNAYDALLLAAEYK